MENAFKWNPINETTPLKDGKYLVTIKDETKDSYTVTISIYRSKGFYSGSKWTILEGTEVVAWAEIPEPYSR